MPKNFYYSQDGEDNGGGNAPDIEKIVADKLAEEKAKWEADNEQRLKTRINETEKGIRERLEREAKKAQMTAEEKAKAEYEERFNATQAERDTFKSKYRDMLIRSKLTEAGLPIEVYFDNKKLDVDDEQLDDVIKTLKKTHDSIISGGKTSPTTTPTKSSNAQTISNEDLEKLAINNPEEYRRIRREKLYGRK
jgi:membrane-associated HD superfamily phosphohydrolase